MAATVKGVSALRRVRLAAKRARQAERVSVANKALAAAYRRDAEALEYAADILEEWLGDRGPL